MNISNPFSKQFKDKKRERERCGRLETEIGEERIKSKKREYRIRIKKILGSIKKGGIIEGKKEKSRVEKREKFLCREKERKKKIKESKKKGIMTTLPSYFSQLLIQQPPL
jgi:hypothetical protein